MRKTKNISQSNASQECAPSGDSYLGHGLHAKG